MMYGPGYGPGWGWMAGDWIVMIVFVALIIVGAVVLTRMASARSASSQPARYAAGYLEAPVRSRRADEGAIRRDETHSGTVMIRARC